MKKKMAIALIMVLVFSNSMVAFGAETSKKTRVKKKNGDEYWSKYNINEDNIDGTNISNDNTSNNDKQQVTANYSLDTTQVYCVDIKWGNMQFTYSKSEGASWDPSNHTYGTGTGDWASVTNGGNCVTIENHSNDKIYATVDCKFNTQYSGLSSTILQTSVCNQHSSFTQYTDATETHYALPAYLVIESAVGKGNTWDTGQPIGQVQLEIDGDPGVALSSTEIGSVTVDITDFKPEPVSK